MIAYKLFAQRKDGSLGPLFINRKMRIEVGKTYIAETHPTKEFAVRSGWHCCHTTSAPHLSKKGRVWCKVSIMGVFEYQRPKAQGGLWYTAKRMTVLSII